MAKKNLYFNEGTDILVEATNKQFTSDLDGAGFKKVEDRENLPSDILELTYAEAVEGNYVGGEDETDADNFDSGGDQEEGNEQTTTYPPEWSPGDGDDGEDASDNDEAGEHDEDGDQPDPNDYRLASTDEEVGFITNRVAGGAIPGGTVTGVYTNGVDHEESEEGSDEESEYEGSM